MSAELRLAAEWKLSHNIYTQILRPVPTTTTTTTTTTMLGTAAGAWFVHLHAGFIICIPRTLPFYNNTILSRDTPHSTTQGEEIE